MEQGETEAQANDVRCRFRPILHRNSNWIDTTNRDYNVGEGAGFRQHPESCLEFYGKLQYAKVFPVENA